MALINQIDIAIRANLPEGTESLYESLIQFVPLNILLAISALSILGWIVWKSRTWWLNWAWVQKYRSSASRRALPQAEIFSIAIAILEGDEKDIVRTQLLDALRDLVGIDALRFDRQTSLAPADNTRVAEAENHKKAQSWLAESKAHVLIWGHIMPASGQQSSKLRLHFTTRDTAETGSIRLSELQVFEFPIAAQAPLAAAVRAQVLAQLGKFQPSHPVAEALQVEISFLQNLVEAWPKGLERAVMQGSLGSALQTVGLQTGQAVVLQKSITAYQEALKECTRERVPLDWAALQNNLGNALKTLGQRQNGTDKLEAAITAYQEALKEHTRARTPLHWAMTQSNLGAVLSEMGERENDINRLEAAVNAYQEALKEQTRKLAPLDWAMTQNNLGVTLSTLGDRENRTDRLEAAVSAYQEALKEHTRKRSPLDWAGTQNNLGCALRILGEREHSIGRLEAAVTAYQEALKEYTRERVPLNWAGTKNNLGVVLSNLGELKNGTAQLKAAVIAYQDALKEYTRERVPLNWAMTQSNLGIALSTLGKLEKDPDNLEKAVIAYKNALSEFEKADNSHYLEVVKRNLKEVEEEIESVKVRKNFLPE